MKHRMMGGIRGTVRQLYGVDLWRYNVRRFQEIDAFIDALRKADILASLYLRLRGGLHQVG